MKKIYLTLFTITTSIASLVAQVPTCALNNTFILSNKIGVYPDSATNFISGVVGDPYVQNLTVKVPRDTISSGIKFCFTKFVVSTPSGITNYNLPPGLMMGSSTSAVANGSVNTAPSFKFPGGANNCASIYGTPTIAGSYTLQLQVEPYGLPTFPTTAICPNPPTASGSILPGTQTLKYYIINITPAVGVQELRNDRMSLSQNFPNPSSLTTDIKFYVEGQDDATVSIYNMLGDMVSSQTIKTTIGENKVTINSSELAGGTYMYTLKYKGASATKRMIVLNH